MSTRGHRCRAGRSAGLAIAALALLVVLAALALVACGGSPKSGTAASVTTPSTPASPATTPSAAADPAQVARTTAVVKALMATWNDEWSANKDRQALSSFFDDSVTYYDATIDGVITKSDMDAMGQDPTWWKSFRLDLGSSFVSADGRFAATLGRIALRDNGGLPWQPAASVLAFADDKVVWEYDYYGGEPGESKQTEPMLHIARGAVAPGSAAARTAISEATAAVGKWLAAYNRRDAGVYLSGYADDARYVDVVSPTWRVMTKGQLTADVASRFVRKEFASKLEPSPGSPFSSACFVSPDGRYAAVQGTYADAHAGVVGGLPMLVILELRAGQIIRQYNFVAMDRSLLQP
jgi:hypothetical protein